MNLKRIKKLIDSDEQQLVLVLKTIFSLPKDRNYRLIDIGAGPRHLEKFMPKNIKYYSLDYHGKHDIIFNLDDGRLPIKDESFDIIVCTETLEHLIHPEKLMEELLRIAKKDAVFLLSMPNEYNFLLRLHYLLNIQSESHEAFETIKKHLHIHSPRVKDIHDFFSKYIDIEEIYYGWHSRRGIDNKGVKRRIFLFFDDIIDRLSKIKPSLFAKVVAIKGKRKI